MTNKITAISVFLAVLLMAGAASAGEFHLTNSNVNQLAGIDIKVTTDGAGKNISVELVNNPLTNTPVGIDKFYYQLEQDISSDDDPSGVWSMFNNPPVNADGFGSFIRGAQNPGGTGGLIGSPITFTLTNTFTDASIIANSNNAKFAVHIRYSGDCSGFVSDGTSINPEDNFNCKPPTSVPEFPAIALPAIAIFGIIYILYRKKKEE